MDSDILNYFKNFQLGAEEDEGFRVELEDVQLSTNECHRSLMGKLYGKKIANFTGFKNTLDVMWPLAKPQRIKELGVNLFQFVFATEQDKNKILNGKAWTFDSQFLILKPWFERTDFTIVNFNKLSIWI